MSGRLVSAAAAALLGALASVVCLAGAYLLSPALRMEFAVDPPRLVTGIYAGERDEASGLTFAWTGRDAAIRLPGLDRRVPWVLELRLRGGRQDQPDNPVVVVSVDGVPLIEHASQTGFTTVQVALPPRPTRPRGALITLRSSSTFVPGGSDPRALGVTLDAVSLSPDGFALPPPGAFTGAVAAGAAMGAALGLLGVAPGLAIAGAVLLAAGQGAVLARGFGPFTDVPDAAARLAAAIGAGLVVVTLAIERFRGQPLRNTARFAVAFSAGTLFLKLLVQFHPDMPIGDALFQAHRFQEVLRGNLYFTSIAPGNYLFPYAPGLYVAAWPFAGFVGREMGDVLLLRTVVAVTDAMAGALLYFAVDRGWGDRLAAAFATALYLLLPLDFMVASAGTLTSAFAQSLAVAAFVLVAAPGLRLGRPAAVAGLMLVCAAAYLSHTSTFAMLSVSTAVVALVFAWRGGTPLRQPALAVFAAGAAAALLAMLLYYLHFMETYRSELARIGLETASAAADAGGRSIPARASMVPYYLNLYFGLPALALAAGGAWRLRTRGMRDPLTLTVTGWTLTCGLFLLLGVLTPVDMRYYVAALPVVAVTAAAGAAHGWAAGGLPRAATAVLLVWSGAVGVAKWLDGGG